MSFIKGFIKGFSDKCGKYGIQYSEEIFYIYSVY